MGLDCIVYPVRLRKLYRCIISFIHYNASILGIQAQLGRGLPGALEDREEYEEHECADGVHEDVQQEGPGNIHRCTNRFKPVQTSSVQISSD